MNLISEKSINNCIETGKMFEHQTKKTSVPARNKTRGRFLTCHCYSVDYKTYKELKEQYGNVCPKLFFETERVTDKRPDGSFCKNEYYLCKREE